MTTAAPTIVVGPIEIGELKLISLNGATELEPAETIATMTRSIEVLAGTDATPADRFVGMPVVSGQLVLQRFEVTDPNMRGNIYEVKVLVTDGSGLRHNLLAHVAVKY